MESGWMQIDPVQCDICAAVTTWANSEGGQRCDDCHAKQLASCRHGNANHMGPRVAGFRTGYLWPVEHLVCLDCGAWLSLGPASDAYPHAEIEMFIAEALAEHAQLYEPGAARDAMDECAVDAALAVLAGRLGDFKPAHCPTASMTESGYDEEQTP